MATKFSDTILADSSVDANIRAWAQFIEDTLVTVGGWTVAADINQTLPSALLHATVANAKQGFRIYRMNDALQATAPVFMRIDYGSGNAGVPAVPGVFLTLGTGSNGSGTITGQVLLNLQMGPVTNGINAPCRSYGSASTNRVAIGMFITPAAALPLAFSVERTKDSTGADTPEGLLLVGCSFTTSTVTLCRSGYCVFGTALASQPVVEAGLNYILSQKNPTETFAPGDVGVGVIIHFKGISQQPGINFLITNTSDVSNEGSINATLYGAVRTFQHLGNTLQVLKGQAGSTVSDTSARVLMRYD